MRCIIRKMNTESKKLYADDHEVTTSEVTFLKDMLAIPYGWYKLEKTGHQRIVKLWTIYPKFNEYCEISYHIREVNPNIG